MSTHGNQKIKRSLTLMELFLCFAILAVLGGLFLSRGAAMLEHYRFDSDTRALLNEINVSKHLALTARCDIKLHIIKKKESLLCFKKTEEPLNLPGVFDKQKCLKHIAFLKMNDQEREHLIITFFGTGLVRPEGCLSLLSKHGKTDEIVLSLTSELFQKNKLDITQSPN